MRCKLLRGPRGADCTALFKLGKEHIMIKCVLEGFTYGTLEARLTLPCGIFDNARVKSLCGKVSIEVNPFVARDRLECSKEGAAIFYYD